MKKTSLRTGAVGHKSIIGGLLWEDFALVDLEADDVVVELDVIPVGRGDEDLAFMLVEEVKQKAVARAVKFAGDVVEEEDRELIVAALDQLNLGDLHGEDERAHLSLAGKGARGAVTERDQEVIAMRANGGEAAPDCETAQVQEHC